MKANMEQTLALLNARIAYYETNETKPMKPAAKAKLVDMEQKKALARALREKVRNRRQLA